MIEHEHLVANGVRFHVARAGDRGAPLLLCLHGFPQCWYAWRHVLERLAGRFLVVAPDLRGYGDTDKPASGYDLATLAADVRELVRALGRERCVLAGHDWGGVIAFEVAARSPELLDHLVVLNAPHPARMRRALLTSPRQLARSWYVLAFQLPLLPERYLAREGGRAIAGAFGAGEGRKGAITKEDRDVFRAAMLKPGALRAALAYYRTSFRAGVLGRSTPPITTPTRVIWGERDPALGTELLHGLEDHVRGPLTIQLLPDVGHWTPEEAPDEVCAALSELAG